MIIVRISGGIGNQLFQYALGRALSLKTNTTLKIDTHAYSSNSESNRSFELAHFTIPNIEKMIATAADFQKIGIPNPSHKNVISRIIRKGFRITESAKPLSQKKIILEPMFNFIPEVLDIRSDCYLSGVWQSEKYFSDYRAIILSDITLKSPLSQKAQIMRDEVESSVSVSIHIRRGDLVHNPILLKKYGELTQEYYSKALEFIKQKTGHSKLSIFIFSDEIGWVKNNMNLGVDTIYVSEYKIPDYEELILMSLCKHNIIAKSSFSWWGAWLNTNPHKIVITPKQHFGDPSNAAHDLVPASWIRI
jgi:hypothetical protein